MAKFFRKYHKWLALIVGVQALIWCISGLYMTAVHIDIIHGNHLIKAPKSNSLDKFQIKPLNFASSENIKGPIESIRLTLSYGEPVYLVKTKLNQVRVHAETLTIIPSPDETVIRRYANEVYNGDANIASIKLLPSYPGEIGGRTAPIWEVRYDDFLSSTLYFLPDTGQLRSKRSDLWRLFDFFWMLHIMDYESREEINNNLLRFASSVGLLLSITGVGLLFFSFRSAPGQNKSYLTVLKKIHKWIGLVLGLQLLLWMLSGLMFSILPHKEVSGRYLIHSNAPAQIPVETLPVSEIKARYSGTTAITSGQLQGQAVIRVVNSNREFLIDPKTLEEIEISPEVANQIASSRYAGSGGLLGINLETKPTTENRRFKLPLWRADFSDEQNTSIYVSASTGQIFGAKTDTWRLFDIFWMLHIMDYSERNDMNNALVIFSASFICFVALTGFLLIFKVFRLADFNWLSRNKRFAVLIQGPGAFSTEAFARENDKLFDFLSNEGYQVPSACGGGGTCGLCLVTLNKESTITEADNALLSEKELLEGKRLSCQHTIREGTKVLLPVGVTSQQLFECEVVSNRFMTPLIKELILEVPKAIEFNFSAGEFILIHFDKGPSSLSNVEVPEIHQEYWEENSLSKYSTIRTKKISRAYSMANPPIDNQRIVLNIRLALPNDSKVLSSGQGSTRAFNFVPGDHVMISGPFGQFHAQENDKEMVFIGGGAGMAPLRAHILHQLRTLNTTKRISFWFGARNQQEIFYEKDFDALAKQHENFTWRIALSDAEDDQSWQGCKGFIHQVVLDNFLNKHKDINQCEFYICGPHLMNKATVQMLRSLSVDESLIHVDDFGS